MLQSYSKFIRISPLIIVILALFLPLGATPASARDDTNTELALLEGDWRQIDAELAHATRLTAIEKAVDGLSWVVRKMASPVLKRTTAPPPRIQFIWDGEQLQQRVIEAQGRERARAVELGIEPAEDTDSRGESMRASWQWTGSGLRLDWIQEQAHGHNLYRVDPDTEMLVVQHTINVTAISDVEPIVFESRFGRNELPAVSSGADAPRRSAGP